LSTDSESGAIRFGMPGAIRVPVLLLAAVAFLAGLYGRFKGIGTWPLGADEFYISRSIDHVLRSGVPRFPCGGYYTRGLTYQYLVAGVRLLALTPEFAGRLVAGLSSLAVLPAAFIVARRIHSSLAGWLTVIILCVSVWEIEMARFARMYAPFQAVFAWYVVCYLRFTVDKEKGALIGMAVLSVLGVLTWEGGVLMGVANLFAIVLAHDNGRLKRVDIARLAGFLVLLGLLLLAARDPRGFASDEETLGQPAYAAEWIAPLWQHPGWALGWLVPAGLACAALPWIWSYRRQWLAAAGLLATLIAAAAHMFIISGGVLALMVLARLIDWRDLSARRARYFLIALASFLIYWLAFYYSVAPAAAPSLIQDLFGFPYVYDDVVRPWGRTLPILSAGLALTFAYLTWTTLKSRSMGPDPIAVLLGLLLLMALAVGASHTPRIETRYTFFLYPTIIALAVTAVLMVVSRLVLRPRAAAMAGASASLLFFAATEDFQPRHLAAVDSPNVNFRVGMSPVNAAHYYPRDDMRGLAQWLAANVRPGDIVITGIPSLDEYYDNFDYFFLDKQDNRYAAYVCRDGRTERWSNHPLLYKDDALGGVVASGRRVFASVYRDAETRLFAAAQRNDWSVTRVWTTTYGNEDVLLIAAKSGATGTE
jgi:hypothetical protein